MVEIRKSKLYKVWIDMKNRCNNPNNSKYKRYGAKGIKVCDEWSNDYVTFYNWAIGNGYKENKERKYTVDRICNSKGYNPENCRLLSIQEQQNNKTTNHWLEYKGEKHTVAEWSRILKINIQTIFTRLRKNLTIEQVLSTKRITIKKELVRPGNQN